MNRNARLVITGAVWALLAVGGGLSVGLTLHPERWAWPLQLTFWLAFGSLLVLAVAPLWFWARAEVQR